MKTFDITLNDLFDHSPKPKVYLPFTNDIIGNSPRVLAVSVEGEWFDEKDNFNIEEFINGIYTSKNKKHKAHIDNYIEFLKEDPDPNYSFFDFMTDDGGLSDYIDDYLESLDFNVVKVYTHCLGFGCSGGPVCETTLFLVEDRDLELEKLSNEDFMNEIIKKVCKVREFDIETNELHEYLQDVSIHLPFDNKDIDSSKKVIAVIAEGSIFKSKKSFELKRFVQSVFESKNPKFKKDIDYFIEHFSDDKDYTYWDYFEDNCHLDDYLDAYLESLDINVAKVFVNYYGMNCGGGYCDSNLYVVEDNEFELSNLSQEEFHNALIEKLKKVVKKNKKKRDK